MNATPVVIAEGEIPALLLKQRVVSDSKGEGR